MNRVGRECIVEGILRYIQRPFLEKDIATMRVWQNKVDSDILERGIGAYKILLLVYHLVKRANGIMPLRVLLWTRQNIDNLRLFGRFRKENGAEMVQFACDFLHVLPGFWRSKHAEIVSTAADIRVECYAIAAMDD